MASQPIQCICEGSSDEAFLKKVCVSRKLNGIKIREWPGKITRGINGFHEILTGMLAETQFNHCKLVVVVADNDGTPISRFDEIKAEIRTAEKYGVPDKPRQISQPLEHLSDKHIPDIVVIMLPWDAEEGNLETLLYKAGRANNPQLSVCVERFVKCATAANLSSWDIAKIAKLKARCMLSASAIKNPDVPIEGAWRGDNGDPFPLNSEAFDQLVRYFKQLIKSYVEL